MSAHPSPADHDEGVGDLFSRLVTEGKALAQAEVEPYKARATERLTAYKQAAIFFGIAGVLALGAFIALLVGLELTLAPLIGPGGATAVVVLVTLTVAGILGLIGSKRLKTPALPTSENPARQIAQADQNKFTARNRLFGTVHALQDKLSPKQIARRAVRDAADKGNAAVDTAKRYPGAAAGVTAAAGLFLARHRIAALFRRKPRAAKAATPAPIADTPTTADIAA